MQGVGGGRLKAGIDPAIERGGLGSLRVDEQGTDADPVCDRGGLQESVKHKPGTETSPLLLDLNAEAGQQDDRDRVPPETLDDARRHPVMGDRAGR